jgi:signal transduction histidine kinase
MPRGLFGKLVVVLLALLCVTSIFYVALTVATTRMHIQEVTQNLHRPLAADLTKNTQLMDGEKVDRAALKKIFDMLMVVNPAIEVYLLDAEGKLLAYSAPPEKIKRGRVSLEPIQAFLADERNLLVRGDDPRDPNERKIFSAAPIMQSGRLSGYLYVVLGGEVYDSVADMFETSWIMRLSAGLAVASLLLVAVVGILSFNWLTRRLRRLTGLVRAFKQRDAHEPPFSDPAPPSRSMDEIDELALTFEEMEQRINEQIRGLEQADSMRRELITNISHDLRTPLASLQGAIETLQIKDRSLSADDKRRYLDLAHKNSQRLGRLITDLFDLATLESHDHQLRIEPFSLADLMQDVAQKFHPAAEQKGLRLEVKILLNTSLVSGDIGLIERVLTNLADNAIKYTAPGGDIEMRIVRGPEGITTYVADNGQGIPAEDLPRVFDRSYQVAKDRGDGGEGSGLGLAIAQRIVQLHGGRLDVESRPGVGTTFSFSLSAAPG